MPRLRPLSGLDAGFLYLEASGTPMHVGSLMLLDAPRRRGYDFHQAYRRVLAERLPETPVLRRVLVEAPLGLGHPMWTEADEVDLDWHLMNWQLPAPGNVAQLTEAVADLHAVMLPRDRPLWRFVVIKGLASGQLALYSKVHHALLDGQGAVALARALLDVKANVRHEAAAAAQPHHAREPGQRARARTALRATAHQFAKLVRALPATWKLASSGSAGDLIGRIRDSVMLAPRTPFNVHVGPERRYAIESLRLATVKGVAKAHGVSVNDVILALCATALREYLRRRKVLPPKPLIAAMPVSLRSKGNAEANNQVSMVQCPLATEVSDPVARLMAIAEATNRIKSSVGAFRQLIPTDFPGLAAPIWATGLSRLWGRESVAERLPALANLVVSNVPGPPQELYLAGARLKHCYPVSIVTHGLALNITVQSYGEWLEFGLVGCRQATPNLDSIARGLGRALDRLDAAKQ